MQIPQNTIDKILSEVDIIKEIEEDVTLRQQGKNYVGVCPFHKDHSPSMFVSPSKGIFKCFVCNEGGNVISYRMKYSQMSFPEACRHLAKKNDIPIPEEELSDEDRLRIRTYEEVKTVLTNSNLLYQEELSKCASVIDYIMTERHISIDVAKVYGLGYSGKYGISAELRKMGYSETILAQAGIISKSERGMYDAYRDRVMFPFLDKLGQVVGFTGRDLTGKKEVPKYKNTAETVVFTKGKHIYGLFQAKDSIRAKDSAYIVEGQFDVIGLYNVGVHNVIGGSGTAFTDAQRRLLSGFTKNVIFVYDGDNAGVEAAARNIPLFIESGFSVRCVSLRGMEDVKDPADLSSKFGEETAIWLKNHERTYVEFLADAMLSKEDNERDTLNKSRMIMNIIAMDDHIIQEKYISQLSSFTSFDKETLLEEIKKMNVSKKVEDIAAGFNGLEFVKDYIDENKKEVYLTSSIKMYGQMLGEEKPYILYNGIPNAGQIQELGGIGQNFFVINPEMNFTETSESDDILMMKAMFKYGLNIIVEADDERTSFISYYVTYYGDIIQESNPTDEEKNEYICRCAEMISYCKQSIQTVNIPLWAQKLKLNKTILKEIIKPYNQDRKAESKKKYEVDKFNNDFLEYNTTSVPSYVLENDEYNECLENYKYYPILNRKGEPVAYMFKTENGGYKRVGDFYMEPLMHVYSKNKEENRRIIKINRAKRGGSIYLEWPSSVFVKLSSVKDMLIMEEHLNFENCTPVDYERIWANMSYGFTTCNELKVLGQQLEGCFCFANGIFHEVEGEWKFELSDELGLMRHGKQIFYSPSYSVVNAGMRYDKDPFEMDKRLSFVDTPVEKRTTFEHWASLMNEVYKINDNGKWAILYAILSAFRSEIYPIDRTFTALFLVGQTESGKTQIAISVRSLFMSPKTQNMNLNSASDAAFFSILEKYRDVPVIMEEYNDEEISAVKFQGLKSCIYDGDGKEKRKSASTNDIDSSAVNAPIVLLGQEAPQRDDGALANRVIMLQVDKKVSFSVHEQDIFNELKQYEKDGLSYILLDILKLRTMVRNKFASQYRKSKRDLENELVKRKKRSGSQNRIINTISFFTCMCLLVEEETDLKLPFTYKEFLEVAIDKISKQVDMITQSDKLGVFFSTIDSSIDTGNIVNGRDFRIESVTHIHLKDGKERLFDKPTRVIYMNMKSMYDKYIKNMDRSEKPIKQSTLQVNIESSPAFIGKVGGYRFSWTTAKDMSAEEAGRSGVGAINNMLVRVMEKQQRITSAVVLDYDHLKKVMDIDFERDIHNNNQ